MERLVPGKPSIIEQIDPGFDSEGSFGFSKGDFGVVFEDTFFANPVGSTTTLGLPARDFDLYIS